jgi:hypothetical protein
MSQLSASGKLFLMVALFTLGPFVHVQKSCPLYCNMCLFKMHNSKKFVVTRLPHVVLLT